MCKLDGTCAASFPRLLCSIPQDWKFLQSRNLQFLWLGPNYRNKIQEISLMYHMWTRGTQLALLHRAITRSLNSGRQVWLPTCRSWNMSRPSERKTTRATSIKVVYSVLTRELFVYCSSPNHTVDFVPADTVLFFARLQLHPYLVRSSGFYLPHIGPPPAAKIKIREIFT